jgi:hypothetical protein
MGNVQKHNTCVLSRLVPWPTSIPLNGYENCLPDDYVEKVLYRQSTSVQCRGMKSVELLLPYTLCMLTNEINTSSLSILEADGCSRRRRGSKKLHNLFSLSAISARTCNNIITKYLHFHKVSFVLLHIITEDIRTNTKDWVKFWSKTIWSTLIWNDWDKHEYLTETTHWYIVSSIFLNLV